MTHIAKTQLVLTTNEELFSQSENLPPVGHKVLTTFPGSDHLTTIDSDGNYREIAHKEEIRLDKMPDLDGLVDPAETIMDQVITVKGVEQYWEGETLRTRVTGFKFSVAGVGKAAIDSITYSAVATPGDPPTSYVLGNTGVYNFPFFISTHSTYNTAYQNLNMGLTEPPSTQFSLDGNGGLCVVAGEVTVSEGTLVNPADWGILNNGILWPFNISQMSTTHWVLSAVLRPQGNCNIKMSVNGTDVALDSIFVGGEGPVASEKCYFQFTQIR